MRTSQTIFVNWVAGFLLCLLLSFPSQAVYAADIPDPRFGVVEAHAAPSAATALGAGWTRVTFRWNEIQPDGPEEWYAVPISDEALSAELAQGRQVVGLIVTTPGWATDVQVGPGVPRGLHLPTESPDNLWATFVRNIVHRYAGRIDHWIVWNEPDIPSSYHMSWGGSMEDFVRLLQVAYVAANKVNPNAVIHMSAITHWWNQDWYDQFLEALTATPGAAASNFFFDVATLHVYFQPETVYDITAHYHGMMRGRGIEKPIWIAETNAAPSQDPTWPVPDAQFSVSLEQQAHYVVQAFALGIASGAERIAIYKMADTESDRQANPEPFGLVRLDGSRRPAFTAYRVAATHLSGFRSATWGRRDAISLVTVDRGQRTTTVVWSRGPENETAMVPARTTQALLVDAQGGSRQVYAERGYYYVDLPGADCAQGCQIGGAPYMVVEDAPTTADTAPTPRSPTPPPAQPSEPAEGSGPETSQKPVGTEPPTATRQPSLAPSPTVTPSPSRTSTATRRPTPSPSATVSATPTPTASQTTTPDSSPTALRQVTRTAPASPSPTPSVGHRPATPQQLMVAAIVIVGLGALVVAARASKM